MCPACAYSSYSLNTHNNHSKTELIIISIYVVDEYYTVPFLYACPSVALQEIFKISLLRVCVVHVSCGTTCGYYSMHGYSMHSYSMRGCITHGYSTHAFSYTSFRIYIYIAVQNIIGQTWNFTGLLGNYTDKHTKSIC